MSSVIHIALLLVVDRYHKSSVKGFGYIFTGPQLVSHKKSIIWNTSAAFGIVTEECNEIFTVPMVFLTSVTDFGQCEQQSTKTDLGCEFLIRVCSSSSFPAMAESLS